jgi:hypothetical protein
MTELTLKVTDESLIPMLRKLFRSIEGVEVATKRHKKSGIELAYEDVEAGRITKWDSPEEMFNTLMAK